MAILQYSIDLILLLIKNDFQKSKATLEKVAYDDSLNVHKNMRTKFEMTLDLNLSQKAVIVDDIACMRSLRDIQIV